MYRLVIVGGGNMGAALVGGLIDAGWAAPGDLAIVEVYAPRRTALEEMFPGVHVGADPVGAHGALVAVKPNDVPAAVTAAVGAGASRVLSIAAGVSLATLDGAAGRGVAVIRRSSDAARRRSAVVPRRASTTCAGPRRSSRPSAPSSPCPRPNSTR